MSMQIDPLRMRMVQRFILGTALLLMGLLLVPSAQAQGPGGMNMSPDERAAARITVLTERVQLTAPQAEQLKPILVKQFTEQTALFQNFSGGDRAAIRTEMQALRTKVDAEILAVLTDAQKTSYKALVEEEAARRGNRGGGGGAQ
jgi:protein CpxP